MSMTRHVMVVGSATLVSRVLGFVRDIAIAGLFGAGARADAFVVAFQFNNLVRRLLTEGALNSAFVPLYLRRRADKGDDAAGAFAGQVIGTVTLVLVGIAIVLALIMPLLMFVLAPGFADSPTRFSLATEIARLMLPYLVLAGPVAVLMGVLNANHRYSAAAMATVLFNVVVLAAIAIVVAMQSGDSDRSAWIVALSIAFAGVCQLALVGMAIWAGRQSVTPLGLLPWDEARAFSALAIPGLIASGIPQLTIIAGAMIVSDAPGAVSFLYYANRLVELPLGIVGIAVGTVMTPALSQAFRGDDRAFGSRALRHGLEMSAGLALPAAIALALLAWPIVHILFERGAFTAADSDATAHLLTALACGLPGHVMVKALSPMFFAREDTRSPMTAVIAGLIVAIAVSVVLMSMIGPVGVAIAIALSGWLSAALLWLYAIRRSLLAEASISWRRLALIVLAAILMGIAVRAVASQIGLYAMSETGRLLHAAQLAGIIVFGLVFYLGCLWLFRIVQAADLRKAT